MSPSRLQSGTTAGGLRGRQDRLDNLVTGRWTRRKGQRICPFLWPADVARQCAFRWILLTWSEFHAQRLASLWRTLQTSIFSVFFLLLIRRPPGSTRFPCSARFHHLSA